MNSISPVFPGCPEAAIEALILEYSDNLEVGGTSQDAVKMVLYPAIARSIVERSAEIIALIGNLPAPLPDVDFINEVVRRIANVAIAAKLSPEKIQTRDLGQLLYDTKKAVEEHDLCSVFDQILEQNPQLQTEETLAIFDHDIESERAVMIDTWMQNNGEALRTVTILRLENKGLKTLPKQIGYLSHLQTLGIDQNEIQTLKDANLPHSLLRLSASRNKLQTLDGIEGLPRLQMIFLNENEIQAMGNFPDSVTNLSLANNQIKTLDGFHWPAALTSINLKGNQIQEVDGNALPDGLRYADFRENNLQNPINGIRGPMTLFL